MISKVLRSLCIVSLFSLSAFAQSSVDTNLVAYWSFEKSSKALSLDETANHYDLAVIEGLNNLQISYASSGHYLSPKSGDYKFVVRESSGKFNSANFTVAALVSLNSYSTAQTIFQNTSVIGNAIAGYQVQITTDRKIQVVFGNGSTNSWTTITNPVALPAIATKYIAVTYDGSTVCFYADGTLIGSSAYTGSFTKGSGLAIVGATVINGLYQNPFRDKIDEIRVYKSVLTGSEIYAIAHPPRSTVIGCWDIQQNGPGQLYTGTLDLSQDANGKVTGTISWNSPYGSTQVNGTINGKYLTLTANWTSPTVLTTTYLGVISNDSLRIENGISYDNNGGSFPFSGVKKDCAPPPPQNEQTQCWTTRQEKSPGSNTWWTGFMNVTLNAQGKIIGGTIDWDVPSHGDIRSGSIANGQFTVDAFFPSYNMTITYSGVLSPDSTTVISGASNPGNYRFDANKVACP